MCLDHCSLGGGGVEQGQGAGGPLGEAREMGGEVRVVAFVVAKMDMEEHSHLSI